MAGVLDARSSVMRVVFALATVVLAAGSFGCRPPPMPAGDASTQDRRARHDDPRYDSSRTSTRSLVRENAHAAEPRWQRR